MPDDKQDLLKPIDTVDGEQEDKKTLELEKDLLDTKGGESNDDSTESDRAEIAKQKQINATIVKLARGEEIPADQQWTVAEAEKLTKAKESTKSLDLDLVNKAIAENDDKKAHKAYLADVSRAAKTNEEVEAFNAEYTALRDAGFSRIQAAQKATKLADIKLTEEPTRHAAIPKIGGPLKARSKVSDMTKVSSVEDYESMGSLEDRIKAMNKSTAI